MGKRARSVASAVVNVEDYKAVVLEWCKSQHGYFHALLGHVYVTYHRGVFPHHVVKLYQVFDNLITRGVKTQWCFRRK